MKIKYFLVTSVLALVACSENGAIEDAARDYLVDPNSARFGEITVLETDKGEAACVTTNAKNRSGYTGDRQIIVRKNSEGVWEAETDVELPHETCVNVFLDTSDDPDEGADPET